MDVQEFVSSILIQLDQAIDKARETTKRDIYFAGDSESRTIEFDIAATTEAKASQEGKAGIRVVGFADGGAQISSESLNSIISRIKFGVNIKAMTKEQEEADRAAHYASKSYRSIDGI